MTDDISTGSVTREDLSLTQGQAVALAATVAALGLAAAGAYLMVRSRARSNRPLYEEPLRRLMGAASVLGGEPPPQTQATLSPAVKSMLMTAVTALARIALQRWLQGSERPLRARAASPIAS